MSENNIFHLTSLISTANVFFSSLMKRARSNLSFDQSNFNSPPPTWQIPMRNSEIIQRNRRLTSPRDHNMNPRKRKIPQDEVIVVSSGSDSSGETENDERNRSNFDTPGSSRGQTLNFSNPRTQRVNSNKPNIRNRVVQNANSGFNSNAPGSSKGQTLTFNFGNPRTQKLNSNKPNMRNGVVQNANSGRYFHKVEKLSSETGKNALPSAVASGKTSRDEQKTGMKRKIFDERAPDFISLSSDATGETQTKQRRLNVNHQNVERSANNPREPYTIREARRLFESDALSTQIRRFYEANKQEHWLLCKKFQLKSALQNAIARSGIVEAQLCLVGSSVNGFGRIKSDADFCLIIDQYSESIKQKRKIMDVLYKIQGLLRKVPFIRGLQVIPARVPILKFTDSYTGMECDLNVNNLTGLRNTELLKTYSEQDQRVQPLTLCVKEWAHQKGINDASQGTLSSYSICLMVIQFLQHGTNPPVVPCLHKVHPGLFSTSIPITDIGSRASRVEKFWSKNRSTLSQLLRGFFAYYTKFDFANKVISVRLGKPIEIRDLKDSKFWREKEVKIEEPFDQSNTARAVFNKERATKILNCFRMAKEDIHRFEDLRSLIFGAPGLDTNGSTVVVD